MKLAKMRKVFLALTVMILVTAALPGSALAAEEDLVRFTVRNQADRNITIRLYSQDPNGHTYYMQVLADTTKIMTPERGVYNYRLTACGIMTFGEVDLTGPLTWQMPDCGDKGGPGSKAPNTQDVGKILQLTKVELVNDTGYWMELRLYGEHNYVFSVPLNGSLTVSIPHGNYVWAHYSCGGYDSGNLVVAGAKVKEFTCD